MKKMAENQFKLSVKTQTIDYVIPAKEIGIEKVSQMLGVKSDSLKEIKVEIKMNKVEQEKIKEIEKQAKQNGYEVVFPPVEFEVIAKIKSSTGQENQVSISKFSQYVERILEIPSKVEASKITTGIVYNIDGTFSHIPTQVFKKDEKYYTRLSSLTNSSYSVIANNVTVASVENHWSKSPVNNMASRLVIKNPSTFMPGQEITRGEFAEYITKAIGVYRVGIAKGTQFLDVKQTDELADAITTAVEHGIIKGYEDKTFRPNEKITREQAMSMYKRAMNVVKLEETHTNKIENYQDKQAVSPWAYDDVNAVLNANVFNGRIKDTIAPKATFTYAEAATAINNLLIESGLINK